MASSMLALIFGVVLRTLSQANLRISLSQVKTTYTLESWGSAILIAYAVMAQPRRTACCVLTIAIHFCTEVFAWVSALIMPLTLNNILWPTSQPTTLVISVYSSVLKAHSLTSLSNRCTMEFPVFRATKTARYAQAIIPSHVSSVSQSTTCSTVFAWQHALMQTYLQQMHSLGMTSCWFPIIQTTPASLVPLPRTLALPITW